MDLATALAVVQTILTAIQTSFQVTFKYSFSDCKRALEDLESTVKTIEAIFLDAEANQDALSHQQKDYILDLNDAVYDANDVLDEFLTLIKQQRGQSNDGNISNIISSATDFVRRRIKNCAGNLSGKVEQASNKFDDIASKRSKFCFMIDNKVITKSTNEETISSVYSEDKIIGRDKDVEKIVAMLLNSGDVNEQNVSFIAIVGIGGLGKTSLAQLIYNDPRITDAFPSKSWICIADQRKEDWKVERLLGKVIRELPIDKKHDLTSSEQMSQAINKYLEDKKYLLALDDVWTEDYENWIGFKKFLTVGQKGSRIILTTRSNLTAEMVADDKVHKLQGLPEEESWHLFERLAFLPKQMESPIDSDLVELGKVIVKMCRCPTRYKSSGKLFAWQTEANLASISRERAIPNDGNE